MFKKLAILTLIATPALAHQATFDQPDFLKMSGGDPVAAQELSMFCAATGKGLAGCKDLLAGSGNLKQEAARKCVQKIEAARAEYKIPPNGEVAGSRGHQIGGKLWHMDYRTDADGEHRHVYSKHDRERAVSEYRSKLIGKAAQDQRDLKGESSTTGSKEVDKHADWGVEAGAKLGAGFSVKEGESQTKSKGLTQDTIDAIEKEAKRAYGEPELGGVSPSILCFKHEKDCLVSGGGTTPNDTYVPDSKDKKDDKKGANNTPPRHEEEPRNADGHVIDHDKTGSWAGNDTPRDADDPMIATTADADLSAPSLIEACMTKEFTKLNQEEGSKTKDPNAFSSASERKAQAEALLKSGYCDESFYGAATCQVRRIKQDSVVDITIISERREAYKSAMEALKHNGICDPQALGSQFCRDQQTQWNTTPADRLIAPKPTRPGTPIRTLPGN